jgi:hypothetical protein
LSEKKNRTVTERQLNSLTAAQRKNGGENAIIEEPLQHFASGSAVIFKSTSMFIRPRLIFVHRSRAFNQNSSAIDYF